MKSGLRRLINRNGTPPVPVGNSSRVGRGHSFNLGVGRGDRETYMRQYGMSGTVFSIVSLLAEASATPNWRLYRKSPQDGRVRYTTGDRGTDQRTEVVQHAALKLWSMPNTLQSGFEFREAAQQHEELTGETYWVLDTENILGIPTSMWAVRPDRMEPTVGTNGELTGWIYTGPSGEQIPVKLDEIIVERHPDPLDPYRGLGPVQAILPNIQQQRYATDYQRNLFLNGASPGGVITVPNKMNDQEFDEMVGRWRESHRGVARAGHIGVLEAGAQWIPATNSNREMEYGDLRLNNRDELREAWRIHKAMLGTSDDVNRANAMTAEETFVAWQVIPRLNRRRDTLNNKLLPLFHAEDQVEFDYDDPSPENVEAAADELVKKATAAAALVNVGFDPDDVCEVVGLPNMDCVPQPAVALQSSDQTQQATQPSARESVRLSAKDGADGRVFEQLAKDFPPTALDWVHHAMWKGPISVPLDHVDWTPDEMDGADPDHVQDFVKKLQAGKKLKPVILVKTPDGEKLHLSDGHHRFLASAELGQPVRAFIATVSKEHGGWETMHDSQYGKGGRGDGPGNAVSTQFLNVDAAELLYRMLSNGRGSIPIETGVK